MSCDNKTSMIETLEGLAILTFLYSDIIQVVDFFSFEWVKIVVIFLFFFLVKGLGDNNNDVIGYLFNTKCDNKDSISFRLPYILQWTRVQNTLNFMPLLKK